MLKVNTEYQKILLINDMLSIILAIVLGSCLQPIYTKSITNETNILLNPLNLRELKSEIYGNPDPKVGLILKRLIHFNQNPEELGTYFEGDILHPMGVLRNGMISQSLRWKNGVVPVEVRGDFNSKELYIINTSFELYHNYTCIKFVQHSTEIDYISITNKPTGCWSSLGRIGGKQILNLQSPMCVYKVGTALHELMHALGFNHEHTREDRDQFVDLDWKNILTEAYGNFGIALPNTTNDFKVEYDYGSILHYSPYAFARNVSKPTIRALKKARAEKMGQREKLSKSDIQKIWKMYKCSKTTYKSMNTNK